MFKGDSMFTPSDIESKVFGKALNGYNRNEVDDFLEKVSEQFEAVVREADFIKTQMSQLEGKLSDYQMKEESLKDALLMAQVSANDIKKRADAEAKSIVNMAETEANKIMKIAETEAETTRTKAKEDATKNLEAAKMDYKEILEATDALKRDYFAFKDKYQFILREQINILDQIVHDDMLTEE